MTRTIPVYCLLLGASVGLADDLVPRVRPEPPVLAPPLVVAEAPLLEPIAPLAASPDARPVAECPGTEPATFDAVVKDVTRMLLPAELTPYFDPAHPGSVPAWLPVTPLSAIPTERLEPALLDVAAADELRPIPLPEPLPNTSGPVLIRVADAVPATLDSPSATIPIRTDSRPAPPAAARVRIRDRADIVGPAPAPVGPPTLYFVPAPVPPGAAVPSLIRATSFWPFCDEPQRAQTECTLTPADECVVQPTEATRLGHLLEAARHFEAAGRGEIANAIRKEVDVARRLHEKQRQLAVLQREIEQLRDLDRRANFVRDAPRQVMIEMTIFEVGTKQTDAKSSRPRHRLLGTEPRPAPAIEPVVHEAIAKYPSAEFRHGSIEADADALNALVELFKTQTGAKVLSRPKIVTLDGQEASVQIGGEFAVPIPNAAGEFEVEFRQFGTRATVKPTIGEDDRVRVELATDISERDFANAVIVEGISVPGLHVRRFRTTAEIAAGRGLLTWGAAHDGVTPFMLLLPEIVRSESNPTE